MRKRKSQNIKLLLILAILSVIGIGIGYSALTQKLTINSSVAINEMKWDIGFSSVADNGGTVLSESTISNDGKTLTVLCDFGSSTKQKKCTTKAVITNNSTFDVGLTKNPVITYDDTYIHTLTFKWLDHPTYENKTVLKDNFIAKGESEEVILTIKSKFLDLDTAPTEETIVPITITLDFAEWEQATLPTKSDLAILPHYINLFSSFKSSTYKEKIKIITFENKINIPSDATESWDIGVNAGKVMAYVKPNETDATYYDLYIQSDSQLYANEDMSSWFSSMTYVEKISNFELLDTSSVTNMYDMFFDTGHNSASLVLDLNSFDTSSVTDMSYMFMNAGYNSTDLTINFELFDTSNVSNMSSMFYYTGYNNNNLTFDVSNFDTSNVTNMSLMFFNTGYQAKNIKMDVRNFNTSKVSNMNYMFFNAGYNDANFVLDVSNFDTSSVTKMAGIFSSVGYNNPNFKLDVSGFDTSKVTDMSTMFYHAGYNSANFTIDTSNFDTSSATNMDSMFRETGHNSTKLNTTITIRNPNVTNYELMFSDVAVKEGTQITVNYTSETSDLVDAMIATKSSNSNVIKGVQVD